eukprot:COSAG05_NODE_302_length_11841_cov_253.738801_6_plen_71_part_00
MEQSKWQTSLVGGMATGHPNLEIRNSETAWVSAQDALRQRIDARVAALVGLSVEHGEHAQIVRYHLGDLH